MRRRDYDAAEEKAEVNARPNASQQRRRYSLQTTGPYGRVMGPDRRSGWRVPPAQRLDELDERDS